MNEVQKLGLSKLKNRVARLQRLVGLEAPAFIIAREVIMIEEAMKLYGTDAWYKALRYTEMRHLKVAAGFCSEEGCDCERARDHAEFPDLCAEHIARLEATIADLPPLDLGGEDGLS